MSLLKNIASFIFSSLFIITLYLAITSYTMGNLVERGNIEGFIQSQLEESVAPQTCENLCNDQFHQSCEEYCNSSNDTELANRCTSSCINNSQNMVAKDECIQTCLSRSGTSQQYINKTIDDLYSSKIVGGISLDDIVPIFRNNVLFLILSLVFGFLTFFISEKPVSKIGKDFVLVAISLLTIAVIPAFLMTSEMSVVKIISDYVMKSFYQQIVAGIVLIAVGIVLMFTGKKK